MPGNLLKASCIMALALAVWAARGMKKTHLTASEFDEDADGTFHSAVRGAVGGVMTNPLIWLKQKLSQCCSMSSVGEPVGGDELAFDLLHTALVLDLRAQNNELPLFKVAVSKVLQKIPVNNPDLLLNKFAKLNNAAIEILRKFYANTQTGATDESMAQSQEPLQNTQTGATDESTAQSLVSCVEDENAFRDLIDCIEVPTDAA
eukprot:CAMPEP_0117504864 /NCGR_PEP_ID=MMETSP0784-20121206/25071_1 /TAXON_ID=39447 /ORGANISM="" /LENGTH=203 /DNA_ID=CAMNT_0005300237 /DNA_START=89 /DNA_END=700 /DNA_ORIENTATION=+